MAYIGEVGKKINIRVTYKKSFDYVDRKYSYYGTTKYIHNFVDDDGNQIVWKSGNPVEYIENDEYKFIPVGSIVELSGTVKEHGIYKEEQQTVVQRCKFNLVQRGKTKKEIQKDRANEQMESLGENDFVWEMPYKQYKEHYSDCETICGSFDRHENSRGISTRKATIKVIIREGRLKNSGVRGKHFYGFIFETDKGTHVGYRAVCEQNARKQMKKDFPNSENFELYRIY